ncbi:MAG: hypothetical protein K2X27_00790 [Candidatus Obscuribacterales bacterium]|nr:hypothetical protein [Candidatus Obscuribacterales bacterium]
MTSLQKKLKVWLFEGQKQAAPTEVHHQLPWWQVMCLTGVDYFSSMGFQPGLAFLAAGLLSPLATLNLVLVTLLGALPTYWLVAEESPHGQGSFAIFENLMKGWKGKTLVLILLGFAATDFVFTITMCAADATAHIMENPIVPEILRNRMLLTLALIGSLGTVFLIGFKEAIKVSFWLVMLYLAVNLITLHECCMRLIAEPHYFQDWLGKLQTQYQSPWQMLGISALVFPQLALGLSGFETGVAVMPLIKTPEHGNEIEIKQRIKNTRKLLITVALIMSLFLIVGSTVCALLIPPELFKEGQAANGRALAYLTHLYKGEAFGTLYDLSTILILWFAGASGMAALLSLVPQYLPRYGMAPGWAAASRPLVIFITAVSVFITVIFKAEVDPQAGAFATGLLVLITSATVAITLSVWKKGLLYRLIFSLISLVFIYSSIDIMFIRPDGLNIAIFFIVSILTSSLVSRALRSTELRINKVTLDETAERFIKECTERWGVVRLLAHKPGGHAYAETERETRELHTFEKAEGDFIFLEVTATDVSDFMDDLLPVSGHLENGYRILRCSSASVPNAIAALLLHIRDQSSAVPHAYFGWTEGNPIAYVLKYVLLGEGETAPITREILRSAEADPKRRPRIHVA